MTTIADFPDAVRRIVSPDDAPDLPDSATTAEEIKERLRERGEYRLTPQVIENMAAALVKESDVRELIDGSDELPDQDTVESLAEMVDEYGMAGREEEVAGAVAGDILTEEELEELIREEATNDEVREAIEGSASTVLGPSVADVVEDTATVEDVLDESDTATPAEEELEEIADRLVENEDRAEILAERAGEEAVTQEQFNEEVAQTVEQQTPGDISTGVGVLSDTNGDPVAVFGGTSESRREQVAEDIGGGVQDLGGNVNDALSDIEQVEAGSEGVEAQIAGTTIAEITK